MKLVLCTIVVAILCGCSTQTQNQVAAIATPDNVQSGITVLGSFIVSKVSPSDKDKVHQFAQALLSLSSATVDSSTISGYLPKVSDSAATYINPLIAAAVAEINLAIVKFGAHNAMTLEYVHKVGQGLLGAGF